MTGLFLFEAIKFKKIPVSAITEEFIEYAEAVTA